MAPGAPITIDGKETFFSPLIFKSNSDDSVTVAKDANGKLLSASKRGQGQGRGRGVTIDVLHVWEDTYITVDAEDLYQAILEMLWTRTVLVSQ